MTTAPAEAVIPRKRVARRRRRSQQPHLRRDIQGLRMVAVLLVLATHLYGWQRGTFIGVDGPRVFFVISGFLITGHLLRMADDDGRIPFRKFYWKRIRRIIPAAAVVLLLTYLASVLTFGTIRAEGVGIDAISALFFVSNWRFGYQETDYFSANQAVSPVQHFWSLSIEEQFYFVWPALLTVIGILAVRKRIEKQRLAAIVVGAVVVLSLAWGVHQSAVSPIWAYFSTFARVWELGVGALLATSVGALARIPATAKPWLSWGGLALIAASAVLSAAGQLSFAAPWSLLPVAGASMVIAAGVGGEPRHQRFLRNKVSGYIGNLSYSLYLVHWPVIVILGALVAPHSLTFYFAAVALSFGLAIASYHFVENPLRYGTRASTRAAVRKIRKGTFAVKPAVRYAAAASTALIVLGAAATIASPAGTSEIRPRLAAQPSASAAAVAPVPQAPSGGPLAGRLQKQIAEALTAVTWPHLDPSMESVIAGPATPLEVGACGSLIPGPGECTWGSPTAPTRVMLIGDSQAASYAGPLRDIALSSGGRVQLHVEAMGGCQFVADDIRNFADDDVNRACPDRKQHTIDVINETKPDIVVIANSYATKTLMDGRPLDRGQWGESMRRIVDTFKASTKKLVWLSAPPRDKDILQCYRPKAAGPADCITRVTDQWFGVADEEQYLAKSMKGVWIDSSPWFCSDGLCPAFVGSTPTKSDIGHMSPAYAKVITPVIGEALTAAGVF